MFIIIKSIIYSEIWDCVRFAIIFRAQKKKNAVHVLSVRLINYHDDDRAPEWSAYDTLWRKSRGRNKSSELNGHPLLPSLPPLPWFWNENPWRVVLCAHTVLLTVVLPVTRSSCYFVYIIYNAIERRNPQSFVPDLERMEYEIDLSRLLSTRRVLSYPFRIAAVDRGSPSVAQREIFENNRLGEEPCTNRYRYFCDTLL